MYAAEYWAGDGTWRWEVDVEDDGREVVFKDVAAAHPLIRKWLAVASEEAERCGLTLDESEEGHYVGRGKGEEDEEKNLEWQGNPVRPGDSGRELEW